MMYRSRGEDWGDRGAIRDVAPRFRGNVWGAGCVIVRG